MTNNVKYWSSEEEEKLKKLKAEHKSMREIGVALGKEEVVVRRKSSALKLSKRVFLPFSDKEQIIIIAGCREGLTWRKISQNLKKVGTSRDSGTLYRWHTNFMKLPVTEPNQMMPSFSSSPPHTRPTNCEWCDRLLPVGVYKLHICPPCREGTLRSEVGLQKFRERSNARVTSLKR